MHACTYTIPAPVALLSTVVYISKCGYHGNYDNYDNYNSNHIKLLSAQETQDN